MRKAVGEYHGQKRYHPNEELPEVDLQQRAENSALFFDQLEHERTEVECCGDDEQRAVTDTLAAVGELHDGDEHFADRKAQYLAEYLGVLPRPRLAISHLIIKQLWLKHSQPKSRPEFN